MAAATDPRAAAVAAAHRRVKRAMGLLRAASAALAPELTDVDVVVELRLEHPDDVEQLRALVAVALERHGGPLDAVILASPSARNRR